MMFIITTYHHHRHHRHYHHHDGRILNTDKKFTFIGRRAVKVVHTGCQVAADFYDHDDDDLVGRPLDEISSWWWQPPMSVCKLCWPLLRAGMAVLDQFFLKNVFFICIEKPPKKFG